MERAVQVAQQKSKSQTVTLLRIIFLLLIVLAITATAVFIIPEYINPRSHEVAKMETPDITDTAIDAEYKRALYEYYYRQSVMHRYGQFCFQHTEDLFRWQLFSSKIIFALSAAVLLTGILFAWWQFTTPVVSDKSLREAREGGQDEVAINAHIVSLTFKTRTLATFVLVVSIVYFALYLIFVYPIKPAGSENGSQVDTENIASTGGVPVKANAEKPSESKEEALP